MNSQGLFVGLYKAEPLQNTKRSYGSNFFYTSSQMWEPSFFPPLWMGDEMYHVKHLTPTVLGKFNAVSVYIPDQLPAVSDLTSTGIPA